MSISRTSCSVLWLALVACSSKGVGDWSNAKVTTVTIALPSMMKPSGIANPRVAVFEVRTEDRDRVAYVQLETMPAEPSFDRDSAWVLREGYTLLHEEPGTTAYSFAYRKVGKPGFYGRVYRFEAGLLFRCTWEVPAARVKGDSIAEWPALKRACESMKFTPGKPS
jgi:hypothetical protein